MRRLLAAFLCLSALPAQAEVVMVKSGEHGAFTRLALLFPTEIAWRIGRTTDGYEIEVAGDGIRFDLSEVYQMIDRRRLKTIWADPATGRLQLGIGCRCHASVDLSRGRLVVVDIADDGPGDQPRTERALDGREMPPLGPLAQSRPRTRPETGEPPRYDWQDAMIGGSSGPRPAQDAAPGPTGSFEDRADLSVLRKALIEELGRGASEGIVRMVPVPGPETSPAVSEGKTSVADPGPLGISAGSGAVAENGTECTDPKALDLPSWASGEPAYAQIGSAYAGILGEFDALDRDVLIRAIQLHLHFGLGSEARLIMRSFGQAQDDLPILWDLSHLVDGETPRDSALEQQQSCPGHTALWAILAARPDHLFPGMAAKDAAQSFLALPAHLKPVLGPELARRLAAAGHSTESSIVLSSLQRGGPAAVHGAALAEAEIALATGDTERAEVALTAVTEGAVTPESLALVIEGDLALRRIPAPETIAALEAFRFSDGKGAAADDLTRALALGKGLSGEFEAAFELATNDRQTTNDLWALLAEAGGDSALLVEGARIDREGRHTVPRETREAVARRLVDLGFPDLAADWLEDLVTDPETAAALALARRNGRMAISQLAGVSGETADGLRAVAFRQLGAFDRAAEMHDRLGQASEARRLRRWSGEWERQDTGEEDTWMAVAADLGVNAETVAPSGLEGARETLAAAEKARLEIEQLLRETRLEQPPEG